MRKTIGVLSIIGCLFLASKTRQNPILSLTGDEDASKQCEQSRDGAYAVRNLTQYLFCQNHTGSLNSCYNKEVYSTANKSCVSLELITEATFCQDRPSGDWENPWDCTKYFHCYFNWYEVHSCESGKVYDATLDACLHPSLTNSSSICRLSNKTKEFGNSTGATSTNGTTSELGQNNVTSTANTTESATANGTTSEVGQNNVTSTANTTESTTANGTASELGQNNVTSTANTTGSSTVNGTTSKVGQNNETSTANTTENVTANGTASGSNLNNSNNTVNQTASSSNDLISLEEVQRRLSSGNSSSIILIDVRMLWELRVEGKIGKSIHIPLPDIETAFQMEREAFKRKYGIDKPEKDNCNLVFHCKSGVRGQRAVDAVKDLGYLCPKNMDGGFNAWKTIYQK